MKMADKKKKALELLLKLGRHATNCWVKPTDLGMAMGRPYYSASAFACPILKALESEGLVESNRGVYRVSEVL